MLSVKLTPEESVALHDQVAAELRRAIADGEAGQRHRTIVGHDHPLVDRAAGEHDYGAVQKA